MAGALWWGGCVAQSIDGELEAEPGSESSDAFVQPGEDIAGSRSTVTMAGCQIRLDACPNHPTMPLARFFADNHEGSATNRDRCLRRADEFAAWCGMNAAHSAYARFSQGDTRVSERTAHGPGCRIETYGASADLRSGISDPPPPRGVSGAIRVVTSLRSSRTRTMAPRRTLRAA